MTRASDKLVITQSRRALTVELFKISLPFILLLLIFIVFAIMVFPIILSFPVAFALGTFLITFGSVLLYFVILMTNKKWATKRYEFHDNNVHIIDSGFGPSHQSFGLNSVVSVKINQTIISNFFNYGSITINFFGGTALKLENVPRPEEQLAKIQKFIDKAKK